MRSALTCVLAAFSLLAVPASSAQTVNPQTGAVCEPQPADMDAVRNKAETGDASAQYQIGLSILSPMPTDSERASAMPWFRRSAEQGYAPAEYMYGDIFRDGRWENPKQLIYWWTKAAEQGDIRAQLWLGVFYKQGRNEVKRDYVQAFKWLSMAAKRGQPDAQVTLGQMYENGEGVPQDYRLAAHWYRRAADHTVDLGGAGLGANSLAQLYQDGHATPRDYIFVYLGYAYLQDSDGMRDVAQKMNLNQIADAQRRVRAWVTASVPCPPTEATTLPASSPVDAGRQPQAASLNVNFEEGVRYRIDELEIGGNRALPADQIRGVSPIQLGEFFERRKVVETLNAVRRLYKAYGYPNVSVHYQLLMKQGGGVRVRFFVKEGMRSD